MRGGPQRCILKEVGVWLVGKSIAGGRNPVCKGLECVFMNTAQLSQKELDCDWEVRSRPV
jgi:hypothetical protein